MLLISVCFLEKGTARTYYIQQDGIIVSSASTTAENSMSAMVVAVATREEYKKQGCASLCMSQLVDDLLNCYDNPAARAIYKRVGFEDFDFWMMYTYQTAL
ncbi:MAG: GNAT family N-acetyltransferase [Bacillus sp. (in: firmicutes)]